VRVGVLSRNTVTNVDNQQLAKAQPVTCYGSTRNQVVTTVGFASGSATIAAFDGTANNLAVGLISFN
jgi:hypothetical protein